MESGPVPAVTCMTPRTVAFSWEHEPGVSKLQSPVLAKKPSSRRTPAPDGAKKAEKPRLRVPPPPGGPGAPPLSPSASKRGVRPEEDPFLAAYLACTANGRKAAGRAGRGRDMGAQKQLGWAGLRLGLGLSCKTSSGVAEESVIRLAKIREVHDH